MGVSMDNLTDLDLKVLNMANTIFEKNNTNWFTHKRTDKYKGLEDVSPEDVLGSLKKLHEYGLIVVNTNYAGQSGYLIKISKS